LLLSAGVQQISTDSQYAAPAAIDQAPALSSKPAARRCRPPAQTDQSCSWVGLTRGLGWVHYSKCTKILKKKN